MKRVHNYAALERFGFERKPVGFKFFFTRPADIKKLDKSIYLCEMIIEAQNGDTFYVGQGEFQCVEPWLLGAADLEPIVASGAFGAREGLYQEPRACLKSYFDVPRMPKGTVNYVALSPLDKIPFDPDVLIITATVPQAQTLLRSVGYSTGDVICTSKVTPCMACAEIYIAPFLSGKMNFTVTGLDLSMLSSELFPPGLLLISVPWNLLPTMLENLEEISKGRVVMPPPGVDAHRKWVKSRKEELRRSVNNSETLNL